MTDPGYAVSAARQVPATPEHAFDVVLPTPLPRLFDRRFGPIPAIRDVRDQDGEWGTVGQTRTILLADGGRLTERLTDLDRPRSFGYELSVLAGPMKALARRVEGRWSFVDAPGGGTEVTWAWRLHPTRAGRAVMPVFGWCWRRYAALALERVEHAIAGR